MTVDVPAGDATIWVELPRVWIVPRGADDGAWHPVESARAYRDRLVLKLEGIGDSDGAAALRGARVEAALDEAPRLPPGAHWAATLVGMEVHDDLRGMLGTVADVAPTGGVDLLVVHATDADELLIPMASTIVTAVERDRGRIRVRLPEGLLELNRRRRRRDEVEKGGSS
jgi:16S rRNA processing protein RimM